MRLNYRLSIVTVALLIIGFAASAQTNSVSIGTTSTNSNAVLWLVSPGLNQGLIIPVGNKASVTTPAKGMLIYDSGTDMVYYFDGAWKSVGGSGGSQTLTLTGNTISISGGNSITLASAPAAGQFYMFDGTNWVAKTLSQDVSNSLGTITVTGIQGKTVSLPNSGIQYLSYDATQSKWVFQTPSGSVPTLANGQILTGNGTTNAATALSLDGSLTGGALTVIGIQGKGLPALPTSTVFPVQLLSFNGTTNTWEFKDLTGANIMTKPVYDPTGKAADAFDLTKHTGWPANTNTLSYLTNNGTGTLSWSTPSGSLPALGANQLLSNNGSNTGIVVGGDLGLSVTGNAGTFTVANGAITLTKLANSTSANQILTSNGTNAPTWVNTLLGSQVTPNFVAQNISTTGTLSSGATTVTGLTVSGTTTTINTKPYVWPNSAAGANTLLQNDGAGNLSWAPGGSLPVLTANQLLSNNGSSTGGISVSGDLGLAVAGTTGTFTIANGAITLAKLANSTSANQILTSNGTNAPTWVNTLLGSQVTPNFVAQNISTTGTLSSGATTVTGLTVSGLSTNGLVKTNGGTGLLSIASSTTDYQAPITLTTTGSSGPATFLSNTLNIPQYTSSAYSAGTGLTLTTNTFSVNTSQNISTLSNLTTKGLVTTTAAGLLASTQGTGFIKDNGTGTISYDPSVYITGNQNITLSGDVTGSGTTSISATVTKINGIALSGLSTGLLKNTTTTGVPTIAVSGTDYAPATSGSSILFGNGTGGFSNVIIGSNLSFTTGTLSATGGLTNPMTSTGDIIYGGASGTPTRLAGGATGILKSNGTTPTWGPIGLATTDVTGILPIANGGTGISTTPVNGQLLIGNSLSGYTPSTLTAGTNISITNGSGSITINSTGLSSALNNGQILVGNGSNVATPVTMGTDATISNTGALTINTGAITSAKILDGTISFGDLGTSSVVGGTAGTIQDNSITDADINGAAAIAVSKLAQGTPGQVLTTVGTTPTWVAGGWGLSGNSLSGTEFIGSTNAQDLIFKTSNTEYARLTSTGFLGIGTSAPHAPLQFSSATANRKIVFYDGLNNDNQFIGFGLSPQILRYQTDNSATDHVFYTGTSSTTSNELMRITGTGNVGIGTTTPISKLDVSGDLHISQITAPSPVTDKLYNVAGSLFWNGINISGGSGWSLSGNTLTGTEFIGSTGLQPLNFKINGDLTGRLEYGNNASTFFGWKAGNANTATNNVAFGKQALENNSTASGNTSIGSFAMNALNSGFGNTAVGADALSSMLSGFNITAIGRQAGVAVDGLTNATAIGYGAIVGASNSLVLGGTGGNAVNVGIGTTTPGYSLEIQSSGAPFGSTGSNPSYAAVAGFHTDPSGLGVYGSATGANGYGGKFFGGFQGVYGSGGSMGIFGTLSGTTSGAGAVVGQANATGQYGIWGIGNGGATAGYFSGDVSVLGGLTVQQNAANALSISGTNTGIEFFGANPYIQFPAGSTTPMMYMFKSGTNNPTNMVIAHSTGFPSSGLQYDDTNDNFNFVSSGSPVMSVSLGTSRVGIGTSTPDMTLSVNGNADKAGGGPWNSFSDRRLKKEIADFGDGLSVLNKINPVRFKYNGLGGYKEDGKEYVGIIAQELQKVAPYMISNIRKKMKDTDTAETDLLMYDANALTYILVNAVKEQQKLIDEQKKQIEELKSQQTQKETTAQLELNHLKSEIANIKKALGMEASTKKK